MNRKKAIAIIIDGILATILIVTGVLLTHSMATTQPPITPSHAIEAFDILQSLSVLTIAEANSTTLQDMVAKGNITNLNNSIMEQIGEFWAAGEIGLATDLSEEYLKDIGNGARGIGLYIDDEPIYVKDKSGTHRLYSAKRTISGIESNKTRLGFNARAIATKTKKNNTKVLMGDVITSSVRRPGSGDNGNQVNITYLFDVPPNSTLGDAYWFIQTAWTDNRINTYINGDMLPDGPYVGYASIPSLEGYLNEGTNTLGILGWYGGSGREAGEDGSSHFVLEYETQSPDTLDRGQRKMLASVSSHCSIRYRKPVFVFGTLSSIDIDLHAYGPDATLRYILDGDRNSISTKVLTDNRTSWNDAEILAAVIGDGYTYADLENKYVWFEIDIDTYNDREDYGSLRQIKNGSYISIDAEMPEQLYGYIDITRTVDPHTYSDQDWGDFYRDIEWLYNSSNMTVPLMMDSQLAWLYWSSTDPDQTAYSNGLTMYDHPPSPLIEEFARFGFSGESGNISGGENSYRIEFSNGYSVNPLTSLVSFTALVPSITPYGETFPTSEDAVQDAIGRLNATLAGFADALEVSSNVISIGDVPSLWGPVITEVRIWE
ncbi:MAG: hypothetical protein ABIC95_07400 [archaeon]